MSKPFIESGVCKSGNNCEVCRNKEGGRAVRISWRKLGYIMPTIGGDDWECPKEARGLPWEFKGKPTDIPAKSRGLGDTIAKLTTWLGFRLCVDCRKRQAVLNKLVPYGSHKIERITHA